MDLFCMDNGSYRFRYFASSDCMTYQLIKASVNRCIITISKVFDKFEDSYLPRVHQKIAMLKDKALKDWNLSEKLIVFVFDFWKGMVTAEMAVKKARRPMAALLATPRFRFLLLWDFFVSSRCHKAKQRCFLLHKCARGQQFMRVRRDLVVDHRSVKGSKIIFDLCFLSGRKCRLLACWTLRPSLLGPLRLWQLTLRLPGASRMWWSPTSDRKAPWKCKPSTRHTMWPHGLEHSNLMSHKICFFPTQSQFLCIVGSCPAPETSKSPRMETFSSTKW